MLSPEQIATIADELAEADRTHGVIPRITASWEGCMRRVLFPRTKTAGSSTTRSSAGLLCTKSGVRTSIVALVRSRTASTL